MQPEPEHVLTDAAVNNTIQRVMHAYNIAKEFMDRDDGNQVCIHNFSCEDEYVIDGGGDSLVEIFECDYEDIDEAMKDMIANYPDIEFEFRIRGQDSALKIGDIENVTLPSDFIERTADIPTTAWPFRRMGSPDIQAETEPQTVSQNLNDIV